MRYIRIVINIVFGKKPKKKKAVSGDLTIT